MEDKQLKTNKKQKIIVITGATSGIGLACKSLFEKNGHRVISLARNNINNDNDFFSCDVSKEIQVIETFKKIKEKYGQIDILINNAGYGISGAVELIENRDIENLFDVNLLGCINSFKYALPLIKKGGMIINMSSVCALFPLPYRSLYCASKASLNMLSLCLYMECKPFNVKVVSICPGDVKTNFTKNRVKVFKTNERYDDRIKIATNLLDKREDRRMPPEKVAKVVFRVSKKKQPKPYVIVGFKYKVLHFAMRFLPTSWLLYFTEKFFGGHNKNIKGENF